MFWVLQGCVYIVKWLTHSQGKSGGGPCPPLRASPAPPVAQDAEAPGRQKGAVRVSWDCGHADPGQTSWGGPHHCHQTSRRHHRHPDPSKPQVQPSQPARLIPGESKTAELRGRPGLWHKVPPRHSSCRSSQAAGRHRQQSPSVVLQGVSPSTKARPGRRLSQRWHRSSAPRPAHRGSHMGAAEGHTAGARPDTCTKPLITNVNAATPQGSGTGRPGSSVSPAALASRRYTAGW